MAALSLLARWRAVFAHIAWAVFAGFRRVALHAGNAVISTRVPISALYVFTLDVLLVGGVRQPENKR